MTTGWWDDGMAGQPAGGRHGGYRALHTMAVVGGRGGRGGVRRRARREGELPDMSGTPVPLFRDLLLHDVAMAGRLGIVPGDAGITEFRTPPLGGIGQTGPSMHDGRSATREQSIIAHPGEAEQSAAAFLAFAHADQEALVAFQKSL